MASHSPAVFPLMANKDLELALRIKADLKQGQDELARLKDGFEQTGAAAETANVSLNKAGETAEQQSARIRQMVDASLAQSAAHQQNATSLDELTQSQQRAAGSSQEAAQRQTMAMQASWDATRKNTDGLGRLGTANRSASEGAAAAAAATQKQSQELSELLGKIDPVIRELDRLDAQERQLMMARREGRIDLDTYDRFNAKLSENRARLTQSTHAMGRAGITAGQYQQAMRQLPMQITDVTTSLVSGMPIWMVAIQQGGQIKDSFGGVGPAFKAVTSAINPMTLAIGAAVAAAAALVIAHEMGAGEARAYREALIMTGNAAGTSSDQMNDMAERIDGIAGTQRQAAAALAEIAKTGKISGEQMEQVALTAIQLQIATGKAVSETIAEYVKLAEDPVDAIAKLNDRYNFLTAAVFEQIMALKEQGDEAGAARLAFDTYSDTMQSRSAEIVGDLGLIEAAWKGIKVIAAETWDAMLGIGRETSLTDQLEAVERKIRNRAMNATPNPMGFVVRNGEDERLEAKAEQLRLDVEAERKEADRAENVAKTEKASIEAQKYLAQLREESLTRIEKKEKAIAEYQENLSRIRAANPDSALLSDAQIAKDMAAIDAKFAEPKTRTPVDRDAQAATRFIQQLEKEASTYGKSRAELRKYEMSLLDLSDAQRARAETAAAALATAEAQAEADKQATQDTKLLAQLQLDYLKATGQAVEAAEIEIEKKYGELRGRLLASGDKDGASLVDKLIGIEKAGAAFAELESELNRIYAEQARREQSIQTEIQAGLISEREARRQIIELHQATAEQIEELMPRMRELAEATGDPAALDRLKDMSNQLETLRTQADELTLALRDGLESGLQDAIMGLADGTMSLRDAIDSLLLGVAESMAQMASEGLAEMAAQGIMDLFRQGAQAAISAAGQKAAAEVAAINTVTAAQTIADTTRATSSVVAANTAAAGQATAAATTATAWTPAAIAASIGSFGSAAAIGLAAVVAAMAFQAFADGGHVQGPGTGTSDSINARLSNNEYVTRAAVVTQPGALSFLDDFNQRGMSALDDWAGAAHHSTGGLSGVPAPAAPAPVMNNGRLADPGAKQQNTTLKNAVNLYAVQNPAEIASMAWGREGEEHFEVYLQKNGARVRQLMGMKG